MDFTKLKSSLYWMANVKYFTISDCSGLISFRLHFIRQLSGSEGSKGKYLNWIHPITFISESLSSAWHEDEMEDIDTDHLVNVLCDPNQDVKTESPQEHEDKQGHSNTTFFSDDTKTNR